MYLAASGCVKSDPAEEMRDKIDGALRSIELHLKEDPSGAKFQASLSKSNLANWIIAYCGDGDVPLETFSAVREKKVAEVEQWLSPYEGNLIAVLKAGQGNSSAIMGLLQFAAPTERLRDALLDVGRNADMNEQYSAKAYDLIFKLGLENDQVLREVMEKTALRNGDARDQDLRDASLAAALLSKSTGWGRREFLEMYRKFLNVPYQAGPQANGVEKMRTLSNYDYAFTGLKAFGKLDGGLVDLMKKRMEELRLSGSGDDKNTLQHASDSVDIAEGRVRPLPLTNFKGRLLGVSRQAYPSWLQAHPVKPLSK